MLCDEFSEACFSAEFAPHFFVHGDFQVCKLTAFIQFALESSTLEYLELIAVRPETYGVARTDSKETGGKHSVHGGNVSPLRRITTLGSW